MLDHAIQWEMERAKSQLIHITTPLPTTPLTKFQGTCTYTAARSCHLEGSRLKAFSVVVENEKWTMTDTPNVAVAKLVAVKVYDTTLVLRMNQLRTIMVSVEECFVLLINYRLLKIK